VVAPGPGPGGQTSLVSGLNGTPDRPSHGSATGSATMGGMPALHIRNVPESVVTVLRERAARHGQSMQQEIRQILEAAAKASPPREAPAPVRLSTVRTAVASTWDREEIYGDAGR